MASEAPGYAPAEVLNTRFFGGEFGSGKVATPAKASRGVDHTSLLITPLNRGDGGRVAAPSPSILDRYFPRKTTSPGRSTGTAQLNNMATAATPPRCSTPSFSSKGSAAGHPLRSPLIGTSDIRSRLHTFSLTPPPSGSLLTPQTRTSSTGAEFSISALRAAKGSSLPGSAESIAARSRANQLQAEVRYTLLSYEYHHKHSMFCGF